MIITILSEPRSGSTNLTNWFFLNKKFTTLFIPSDPKSKWYQIKSPKEYEFKTEHLLIKEDYYHYKNYDELINLSNKVILLYRENIDEQIDSWVNAKITNNWDNEWSPKNIRNHFFQRETIFFNELKFRFKKDYLDKNHFKISYEELYYRNGFQKILDYLDIDGLENKNFPYGKKYRINENHTKHII